MGKKLYESYGVSPEKTKKLQIPELAVLAQEGTDTLYSTVTQRYFSKEKPACPTCRETKTRVSKIVTRKLKDILPSEEGKGEVIDMLFNQRYYRCCNCGNRVFPEEVTFTEPGCRYTNRLSDLLAEGTLTQSYSKVCARYGVPASKTSVGVIMRRIFRQKLGMLPPLKTPITLSIFMVQYFCCYYPVVMNVADDGVYFIDILDESSENAYRSFFKQFEAKEVKRIFVDADEQLISASSAMFPQAQIAITDECLLRYVKNAFHEIIEEDGKHSGIPHRADVLTRRKDYLLPGVKRRVHRALDKQPRLRAAYNAYQELLIRLDAPWTAGTILQWIDSLPEYIADETQEGETLVPLQEFDIVKTILELYAPLFENFLQLDNKPSPLYASAVAGIIDAVANMPCCIYDVLRARMTLNSQHVTETINGQICRIGIPVDTLIQNMNAITDKIKEERDNDGY